MHLPTKDGINVIVPNELELSSVTPVLGSYIEFDLNEYSATDIVRIIIIDFWSNEDPNNIENLDSYRLWKTLIAMQQLIELMNMKVILDTNLQF